MCWNRNLICWMLIAEQNLEQRQGFSRLGKLMLQYYKFSMPFFYDSEEKSNIHIFYESLLSLFRTPGQRPMWENQKFKLSLLNQMLKQNITFSLRWNYQPKSTISSMLTEVRSFHVFFDQFLDLEYLCAEDMQISEI